MCIYIYIYIYIDLLPGGCLREGAEELLWLAPVESTRADKQ